MAKAIKTPAQSQADKLLYRWLYQHPEYQGYRRSAQRAAMVMALYEKVVSVT